MTIKDILDGHRIVVEALAASMIAKVTFSILEFINLHLRKHKINIPSIFNALLTCTLKRESIFDILSTCTLN